MGSTHLFPHGMNKGQLSWSSLNCWFGMSHLQLVFRTFWLSRLGFLNLHLWPPRILGPPCLEHKVCQQHKGMAPGQLILPRLSSDLSPSLSVWAFGIFSNELWSNLLSSVRVLSCPLWHIPIPGIRAIPVPCSWCPLPLAPSPDTLLFPSPFSLLLYDLDPHFGLHGWRMYS